MIYRVDETHFLECLHTFIKLYTYTNYICAYVCLLNTYKRSSKLYSVITVRGYVSYIKIIYKKRDWKKLNLNIEPKGKHGELFAFIVTRIEDRTPIQVISMLKVTKYK